jgi:hypothetical protein
MNKFDLRKELTVFVITNGRSTFEKSVEFINSQENVELNVKIIKDKSWLDANLSILEMCDTPFFLRLDDDMVLHKKCVSFMWPLVAQQPKDVAMVGWRLWEGYSNKVCKGVKIYTTELCKKIGFRISKLGKIDKCFKQDCQKSGYRLIWHEDVVGVHVCSVLEEHIRYAIMRGEDNGPDYKKKEQWMHNTIGKYSLSLDDQCGLTGKFLTKLNRKKGCEFYDFIK